MPSRLPRINLRAALALALLAGICFSLACHGAAPTNSVRAGNLNTTNAVTNFFVVAVYGTGSNAPVRVLSGTNLLNWIATNGNILSDYVRTNGTPVVKHGESITNLTVISNIVVSNGNPTLISLRDNANAASGFYLSPQSPGLSAPFVSNAFYIVTVGGNRGLVLSSNATLLGINDGVTFGQLGTAEYPWTLRGTNSTGHFTRLLVSSNWAAVPDSRIIDCAAAGNWYATNLSNTAYILSNTAFMDRGVNVWVSNTTYTTRFTNDLGNTTLFPGGGLPGGTNCTAVFTFTRAVTNIVGSVVTNFSVPAFTP